MRTALITGAGTGMGWATAVELATNGYDVVATARKPEALDGLAEHGITRRLQLDVTDDASVAEVAGQVPEVDVLVNNAGVSETGPLEFLPIEAVRRVMETNFYGPLRTTKAWLPGMRERGQGCIVNVSSVQGKVATPLGVPYSASKWALEAMSQSLHIEVGHFGIRVVLIEPGYIAPGMKNNERHGEDDPYDELRRQYEGVDSKVLGGEERPGPEIVGRAIREAIETEEPKLRWPVGEDAEMILATRDQLGDAEFEATMRSFIGLTW